MFRQFLLPSVDTEYKVLQAEFITSKYMLIMINCYNGMKEAIPSGLRSCVVYKFLCVGCNACYVGETSRHFSTRVREHLATDRASHVFKHLQNSQHFHSLCSTNCFHILDHASTSFQLKIKEAIHIQL